MNSSKTQEHINHLIERVSLNLDDEIKILTALTESNNINQLIDEITSVQEDILFNNNINNSSLNLTLNDYNYTYSLLQLLKERLKYLKSKSKQ